MRLSPETVHLLSVQDGVIAAWQPGAPSLRSMREAHQRGHWRRLTSRTYAASPAEPTEQQRLWSAVLHCGPHAILGGRNALVVNGWKQALRWPTDVIAPRSVGVRVPRDIRVHRLQAFSRSRRSGIPRSTVAQACLDAAAWARTEREAAFLVVSVLQQRLTTPDRLRRLLAAQSKCPRRALIQEVISDYTCGVTTMGERDFSRLCTTHGIRTPDRQVRRKDSTGKHRYLDAHFDAERVVVEIDGFGHLDPEQWIDDLGRQNDLVLGPDHCVLRVSTWEVKHDPDRFIDQLQRALGLWCTGGV